MKEKQRFRVFFSLFEACIAFAHISIQESIYFKHISTFIK